MVQPYKRQTGWHTTLWHHQSQKAALWTLCIWCGVIMCHFIVRWDTGIQYKQKQISVKCKLLQAKLQLYVQGKPACHRMRMKHTSHRKGITNIQNHSGRMLYVKLVITRPGHVVCEYTFYTHPVSPTIVIRHHTWKSVVGAWAHYQKSSHNHKRLGLSHNIWPQWIIITISYPVRMYWCC